MFLKYLEIPATIPVRYPVPVSQREKESVFSYTI